MIGKENQKIPRQGRSGGVCGVTVQLSCTERFAKEVGVHLMADCFFSFFCLCFHFLSIGFITFFRICLQVYRKSCSIFFFILCYPYATFYLSTRLVFVNLPISIPVPRALCAFVALLLSLFFHKFAFAINSKWTTGAMSRFELHRYSPIGVWSPNTVYVFAMSTASLFRVFTNFALKSYLAMFIIVFVEQKLFE